MSVFAELKRRNVIRMAGLYLVGAWMIVQVAETVLPVFDVPNWVLRAIMIVLALGFLPALIFAWIFELTPEGIKRDHEVDRTRSIAPRTGQRMNIMIATLLSLGLAWYVLDRFVISPTRNAVNLAASLKPIEPAAEAAPTIDARSIAVLPFENLSEEQANAYFADGIQDMILTKLAGIGDLKVISRTSTDKYKSRPDNLKLVAQQLGVATILEGSVQKIGNEVLINVQLIDANNDNHLWAEAYPRTLDNIFGVEGEVAQKIADALKAKLTASETTQVAEAPTRNTDAYLWFLKAESKAQHARKSQQPADYLATESDYRQAMERDPDFALAYARLAYAELLRHWYSTRMKESGLAEIKADIDRALALAPLLPEAHLALGYYHYWGFRNYADANVEFKRTLELAPNNVDAISGLAFTARRSGNVDQALDYLKKAVEISPRDASLLTSYGETFSLVRRYAEADTQLRRSLILAPDDANTYDVMLPVQLFGFGNANAMSEFSMSLPDWRFSGLRSVVGDTIGLLNSRVFPLVFERRFDDALRAWEAAPADTEKDRTLGQVARLVIGIFAGDGVSMRSNCTRLLPLLQAEVAQEPESTSLLQQLSWVNVCMGRNAEAIEAAQRAVELMPLSTDSYNGTFQLAGLAQIAAWADDHDLAISTIKQLLAMPAGAVMSVTRLKLDPVWDPLRKDPRFQALLEQAGTEMKSGDQR